MADGVEVRAEAWTRAEEFMEAWNDRGNPKRVGGPAIFDMTLALARFLVDFDPPVPTRSETEGESNG